MQIQAVKPRGDAALLESLRVLMGILLLHFDEAGDAEVWEVLAVGTAAVLIF
jgi:hypothetical protein